MMTGGLRVVSRHRTSMLCYGLGGGFKHSLVSHSSLFGIFYFIQRVIQSKPALFDLGTATDKEIDRQYESVSLTMGTLHATYISYKSQTVKLEKEIRELEIGLAESEAQELEIFKARLR